MESGALAGFTVIELAAWAFVPSAGAVLADWGATVIKIETPEGGDPMRGLRVGGAPSAAASPINHMLEISNRGKRSVGLDPAHPKGHELLMRLVETADVFTTSHLPRTRAKLGIDVEDIRARNARIVYGRGTGWGVRGDDAERGGYDAAAFAARGGVTDAVTPVGVLPKPARPAYGDIMAGLTLAGGIAAALLKRERTGDTSVVDVSLLGTAVWNLAPDITAAKLYAGASRPSFAIGEFPNPLSGVYRTGDGRFIQLVMLDADRWWSGLCERLGRAELAGDPRFTTMALRYDNRVECCAELAATFGSAPLAHWSEALAGFRGVWSEVRTPGEVADDAQVLANGFLQTAETAHGPWTTASSPVQFDENPCPAGRTPEHGEHTDEVLLELGIDMEELIDLKIDGAVL